MDDFKLKTTPAVDKQLKRQVRLSWMIDQVTIGDCKDMMRFLPNTCENVVDLGCGTGRVSVILQQQPELADAKFWLVDGNYDTGIGHYGVYDDEEARFYNTKEITEECCDINGLTNYEYITMNDKFEWDQYPSDIDFLFSVRSVGCHWPLRLHHDSLQRVLRKGAVCVFMNQDILGDIPPFFQVLVQTTEIIQRRPLIVLRYNP